MSGKLIRLAVPDDAAEIARVHVESWQACYRGQMPDEILDSLSVDQRTDQWRKGLTSPTETGPEAVFVATDEDDQIVGFASCGRARGEHAVDGAGELGAIYLVPSAWDKGIGQALHDSIIERLRTSGYPSAMLWVLTSNERARRFYEKVGWSWDGYEKMYHRDGHAIPEVRYVKDLRD